MYNCLCIPTKGPPINQQFDPFYYVIANDSFTLNCTANIDPDSRDRTTFLWYRDNHDITSLTTTIATYTSQLYIEKLDSDQHSGRYICEGNNEAISTTTVIVES